MSAENQAQRPGQSAAAICQAAEISGEARELLQPGASARQYVDLLVEKEEFPDAVRFLSHALPKREAVWWAWVCARRTAGDNPPAPIKDSLAATEKWIAQPTEENRRNAMRAAEVAELSTPAGCAGLGAFFSGGSLSPPEAPPNPPGEFLTAKAVAGAVIMAVVTTEPEKAAEKYRTFIAQAIEVTQKIRLWEG
jgi:hypothetical protein